MCDAHGCGAQSCSWSGFEKTPTEQHHRSSTEVKPQKKSRLVSRAAWPAVPAMAGADREPAWNVQLMFHSQIIGSA